MDLFQKNNNKEYIRTVCLFILRMLPYVPYQLTWTKGLGLLHQHTLECKLSASTKANMCA